MKWFVIFFACSFTNAFAKQIYGTVYNISSQKYEAFFPLYLFVNNHYFLFSTTNAFGEFDVQTDENIHVLLSNNYQKKIYKTKFRIGLNDTLEIFIENQKNNFYQHVLSKQINIDAKYEYKIKSTIDAYGLHYDIKNKKIIRNALPTSIFKSTTLIFDNNDNNNYLIFNDSINKAIDVFRQNENRNIFEYSLIDDTENNYKYLCLKYDFAYNNKKIELTKNAILLDITPSMQVENNANKILTILKKNIFKKLTKTIEQHSEEINTASISKFKNCRLMIISDEDFLLKNESKMILPILKKNNIQLEIHLLNKNFAFTNDNIEHLKSNAVKVVFHNDISSIEKDLYQFYNINNSIIFSDFESIIYWNEKAIKNFEIIGFNTLKDYESNFGYKKNQIRSNEQYFFIYKIQTFNTKTNIAIVKHKYLQHQKDIHLSNSIIIN